MGFIMRIEHATIHAPESPLNLDTVWIPRGRYFPPPPEPWHDRRPRIEDLHTSGIGDVNQDAVNKLAEAGYPGATCFPEKILFPGGFTPTNTCSVPGYGAGFDAAATAALSIPQIQAMFRNQLGPASASYAGGYLASDVGGAGPNVSHGAQVFAAPSPAPAPAATPPPAPAPTPAPITATPRVVAQLPPPRASAVAAAIPAAVPSPSPTSTTATSGASLSSSATTGVTPWLTQTAIDSIPNWVLLAAAAGALLYFSTRRK